MTTFAYTTGNPANLTGGAAASMNDIQGPFNDIKTYINGTNIDDTLIVSPNNPVWRPILSADGPLVASSVAAGTNYWFQINSGILASGTASSSPPVLWLPPAAADVAVAGKTTRLRLRAAVATNGTASGVNILPGFFPITAFAGGAGQIAPTLGAAVLSATVTTPGAGSGNTAVSSTIDLSSLNTATTYCFGVAVSGSMAAGSYAAVHIALEMRHT